MQKARFAPMSRHPRQRLRLLGLLLLTACSSLQSPADQRTSELQSVVSAAATAHLAGDAWVQGTVPSVYARQTLQTAADDLQSGSATLTQLPPGTPLPQEGRTLPDEVQRLSQVVQQMVQAVEHEDRPAMTPLLAQLRASEDLLQQATQDAGAAP
jgi:hypothetical protein